MVKSNKILLFFNVAVIIAIVAIITAIGVKAWTNPTDNPTAGGGALYYSGGNVGIGTTEPSATLEVTGTVKMFGAWATKTTSTVYQAASDGYVKATIYSEQSGNNVGRMTGYTDSSNPPTTIRAQSQVHATTGADPNVVVEYNSFTMPVRKGDYWKVTFQCLWGDPTKISATIYWLPLGN